jgi:two-component system, OmpR family, response regulator ChvI
MAEEISFIDRSEYCCVCFIDIVDSTRITTVEITHPRNIKRYYSIFINTMAAIIRDFDATIIKNTGDSPKTTGLLANNISSFRSVFECGLTMISVNPIINTRLKKEELPYLHYRISADYGRVEVAKSLTSTNEDLFGSTVNLCSKINSMAQPNNMVIGNNLYQVIVTRLDSIYNFDKVGEYSIDNNSENRYPVYSITSKSKNANNNRINLYRNIV